MGTQLFLAFTFVCIVGLGLFNASVDGGSVRSGFEEPCDLTLKCNKSQWLSCQDGVCDCTKPEEMVYDSWKQKCASKAGERCKFEVDETTVLDTDTVFRMFEKAECVTNGQCGTDGTCGCKTTFYEAFDGTCVKQAEFQEQCASNDECRTDKFLSCIDGVCSCNSSLSVYSPIRAQCVGVSGQKCLNRHCTQNAECNELWDVHFCACKPESDFYQDGDGFCQSKKFYGQTCLENKECVRNASLTCEDGACGCSPTKSYEKVVHTTRTPNPIYLGQSNCDYRRRRGYGIDIPECKEFSEETEERQECVGRANQECNTNSKCVKNASCKNGQCICDAEFYPNSDGSCVGFLFR